MNRIDKLLLMLKDMERSKASVLCRTPAGEEKVMYILDAMRTGCTFIRTLGENHDYDELYKALLSGEIDCSDLPEVE